VNVLNAATHEYKGMAMSFVLLRLITLLAFYVNTQNEIYIYSFCINKQFDRY